MASSPITAFRIEGEKVEVVTDFLFLGSKITADGGWNHEIRGQLPLGRKTMTNIVSIWKSRHYSANKGPYSQGCGLPSGHIWLWELDCKESRAPKNRCLWIMLLGKIPESPLDSGEIKPVSLKGNQPWILVGRTDAEAEALVFWSSDVNSQLIRKSLMLEKIEGRRKKSYRMR